MQVISEKEEMIFRKDYNGKPSYSLGLSKKGKDGKFMNGYIKVNFRKGVELNHKAKIKITDGWLDFYKDNDKTVPTIFINEYEVIKDGEEENQNVEIADSVSPFEEFGNSIKTDFDSGEQIKIEDEDLPF